MGIFLYTLVFFLLRVLSSNTLNCDEAEQFMNSMNFDWGYSSQAPLFTWLLILNNQIFQDATISINVLKYLLIFAFLFVFYKSCQKLEFGKLSTSALLSLVLIPAYSYELHRDLTHTTLLAFISAMSFYWFLRLSDEHKNIDYVIWGLTLGLGFLAKYNFVFLLLPLLFISLFFKKYRKTLFDLKILLSIMTSLLVLLPHLIWLSKHKFSSIAHAVNKFGLGGEGIDSYKEVSKFVFGYFPSFIVVIAVLLLFFGRSLSCTKNKFLIYLAISCLSLPVLMTLVSHGDYFNYRWLVPILFLIPLAFFANLGCIDTNSQKRFNLVCLIVLIVIIGLRYVHNFHPDLVDRAISTNIPAKALVQQFISNEKITNQKILIISHNRLMLANFKNFYPAINDLWLEELSNDYYISDHVSYKKIRKSLAKDINDYEKVFLIWEGKRKIPEKYQKLFSGLDNNAKTISCKYIHSKKFNYKLSYLEISPRAMLDW